MLDIVEILADTKHAIKIAAQFGVAMETAAGASGGNDIGEELAAFNLLLVFAFLTPTRGAVATIVREKELRLREGMRILGLKVILSEVSWHFVLLKCSAF